MEPAQYILISVVGTLLVAAIAAPIGFLLVKRIFRYRASIAIMIPGPADA